MRTPSWAPVIVLGIFHYISLVDWTMQLIKEINKEFLITKKLFTNVQQSAVSPCNIIFALHPYVSVAVFFSSFLHAWCLGGTKILKTLKWVMIIIIMFFLHLLLVRFWSQLSQLYYSFTPQFLYAFMLFRNIISSSRQRDRVFWLSTLLTATPVTLCCSVSDLVFVLLFFKQRDDTIL